MIDLEKPGVHKRGKRKGQQKVALGIKDENDWRDVYKNTQEFARDLASYSMEMQDNMGIEEIIETEAWRLSADVYDELDGQKMPGKNDDETLEHIKDVIVKKLYEYQLDDRLKEEFDLYDEVY